MRFTAAGDAIIQRRIQNDFAGFKEITPFVKRGDARFFNLETTLNREGECFASQFSGGTYIRTNPEMLEDIKKFGFNMTSFNNNHAMDFSYEGLLKTLEHLDAGDIVHAGVGRNLDEAAAPRYLETPNGRVALIAVNTSFDPSMMAGTQGRRVPGRPGINGLRIDEKIIVTKDELEMVKNLAERTQINAEKEITRKEGYHGELPAHQVEFGPLLFEEGEKGEYKRTVNKADMVRVEKAIYEAQFQADYIMISVHSHQLSGDKKETPSEFLRDFAHACIDSGANAVVGHGPHLLRPMEIYKDCPIFYSLGDFILQLYSVEFAPEDFYGKYGMTSDATMHQLLKQRSKDFTVGLMTDRRMFQSVIPYWETKDKKITKLELLPIECAMQGNKSEVGLPRIATNLEFVERLAEMSAYSGIRMKIGKDSIVTCEW